MFAFVFICVGVADLLTGTVAAAAASLEPTESVLALVLETAVDPTSACAPLSSDLLSFSASAPPLAVSATADMAAALGAPAPAVV